MKLITEYKCINCKKSQKKIFTYKSYNYYKCNNCQLVSTLPYPTNKEILNHYKDGFKKGNYKFLREFSGQYKNIYKQIANLLENSFVDKNLTSKKILDVGCFTGEFLELLHKRGANVYGIELQSEAVRLANKKLPGKIKRANLNNYKIGKSKFDAVSLLGIVEHVKDPIVLIRQCSSILNNNGLLIIQTPNSASFFAKILGKYWPPYTPIEHIHLFGRKSMEVTLINSGFSNIRFLNHWKKLPVRYVYNMFSIFGPEFHKILKPFDKYIAKIKFSVPFYIGEMIIIARKK